MEKIHSLEGTSNHSHPSASPLYKTSIKNNIAALLDPSSHVTENTRKFSLKEQARHTTDHFLEELSISDELNHTYMKDILSTVLDDHDSRANELRNSVHILARLSNDSSYAEIEIVDRCGDGREEPIGKKAKSNNGHTLRAPGGMLTESIENPTKTLNGISYHSHVQLPLSSFSIFTATAHVGCAAMNLAHQTHIAPEHQAKDGGLLFDVLTKKEMTKPYATQNPIVSYYTPDSATGSLMMGLEKDSNIAIAKEKQGYTEELRKELIKERRILSTLHMVQHDVHLNRTFAHLVRSAKEKIFGTKHVSFHLDQTNYHRSLVVTGHIKAAFTAPEHHISEDFLHTIARDEEDFARMKQDISRTMQSIEQQVLYIYPELSLGEDAHIPASYEVMKTTVIPGIKKEVKHPHLRKKIEELHTSVSNRSNKRSINILKYLSYIISTPEYEADKGPISMLIESYRKMILLEQKKRLIIENCLTTYLYNPASRQKEIQKEREAREQGAAPLISKSTIKDYAYKHSQHREVSIKVVTTSQPETYGHQTFVISQPQNGTTNKEQLLHDTVKHCTLLNTILDSNKKNGTNVEGRSYKEEVQKHPDRFTNLILLQETSPIRAITSGAISEQLASFVKVQDHIFEGKHWSSFTEEDLEAQLYEHTSLDTKIIKSICNLFMRTKFFYEHPGGLHEKIEHKEVAIVPQLLDTDGRILLTLPFVGQVLPSHN